ncbi:beta-microseminoprotein-like isoform X2 [Ranitomeya variabilis]|uniref:beta-microseminoprotein-like isoform X2 n=1 Tax=Ranitomeya variabilis TaxID=490064 RepID=UPI0040578FCF
MKSSLVAFLLGYSFLVTLSNGSCIDKESRLSSSGEKPDGCMDEDIKRALNSTWFKEECMMCTCDLDGNMDCCSRMLMPVLKDPACKATLNKTSCTYIIHRTDNSAGPCDIMALM